MSGQDWLDKDFYATLGVAKDADDATIKKAYRKLARTHHPDRNPGDASAEDKFKSVSEAFAVLSDPEQRQQYDALRAMAGGGPRFASGPGGSAGGFEDLFGGMFGAGGPQGQPNVRFSTGGPGGAGGATGFEDILSGMFGGGGFNQGAPRAARGQDMTASASLPFRAAAEGQTLSLSLADGRTIKVRIPAGVTDGQKIRLAGKGGPGSGGAPAGDLVITVKVEPHGVFTMNGRNLGITVPVSFPEAARGAVIDVPTFEGGSVKVKVPAGTSSGSKLRVKGKGITTKKGTGDLIVTIEVAVPKNLPKAAQEALDVFAQATAADDPRAGLASEARR